MEVPQTSNTRLTSQQRRSLDDFVKLCERNGLLQRPDELQPDDVVDGLNDEATLLY